jgi:hypothetical protein
MKDMNLLYFAVVLLQAYAWPIVVIIVVLLFRESIKHIIKERYSH